MSSPPESKQTPLPTIAIRGWRWSPHSSSISRGARSGAAARADRGDHRIALVERLAGGDRDLGAAFVGERLDRRLQLGRAEIAGRDVDEVADQEGRFGDRARSRRSAPARRSAARAGRLPFLSFL